MRPFGRGAAVPRGTVRWDAQVPFREYMLSVYRRRDRVYLEVVSGPGLLWSWRASYRWCEWKSWGTLKREYIMGEFVKRGSKSAGKAAISVRAVDELVSSRYPALWDYMTEVEGPGKTVRQTATLLCFVEDGAVKLCFNDRDNDRRAFVAAKTIVGALDVLEEGLVGDDLDWRQGAQPGAAKKYSGRGAGK